MSKDQKTKTLFLLDTMVEHLTEAKHHVNPAGIVDHAFLSEPWRSQIRPFNDTRYPQHTLVATLFMNC